MRDWFREEAARIAEFLSVGHDGGENADDSRLSPIGSAVGVVGVWAKPIVDILFEIPPTSSQEAGARTLVANGWRLMSESPGRKSFNRGYEETGFAERVFHLHLRFSATPTSSIFSTTIPPRRRNTRR